MTTRSIPPTAARIDARLGLLESKVTELETPIIEDRAQRQRELDRDLADAVRGVVEVDRAVRRYREHLARGDWPVFHAPTMVAS